MPCAESVLGRALGANYFSGFHESLTNAVFDVVDELNEIILDPESTSDLCGPILRDFPGGYNVDGGIRLELTNSFR